MAKGHKTGGRVKGSLNRRTRDVAKLLAGLACDPIEGMARIAENPRNAPELRGRMYAELAQYLYPKRKAIEVSTQPEPLPPRIFTVSFVCPEVSGSPQETFGGMAEQVLCTDLSLLVPHTGGSDPPSL